MNGDVSERSSVASSAPVVSSRQLLNFFSILIVCVSCAWLTYWFRYWDSDEGFIAYRVVRNLFEQIGWSYNVGERLNPTTSPLHTILILLATNVVTLSYRDPDIAIPLASHIIGGVGILITCLVVRHFFARSGRSVVGTLCAVHLSFIMATSKSWGTEVFLCCSILALFILVEARRPSRLSWMLLGFGVLASLDVIILTGLKAALESWKAGIPKIESLANRLLRKSAAEDPNGATKLPRIRNGLVPFCVPVVPWFVFSLIIFEQLFPEVLPAKTWQARSGIWGNRPVYYNALTSWLQPTTVSQLLYDVIAATGLLVVTVRRHVCAYILLFVLLQQSVYVALDVPATPAHFVFIDAIRTIGVWILVAIFVTTISIRWKDILSNTKHYCETLLPYASSFAVLLVVFFTTRYESRVPPQDSSQLSFKNAAWFIEDSKSLPDGEISSVKVGALGFYSRRRILDLTGLATRNPQFVDGRHNDRFFETPPAIVVFHDPPSIFERAVAQDPRFPFWYDKHLQLSEHTPVLALHARTHLSAVELRTRIASEVKSFDPILMVNPKASPQTQCMIDIINGEKVSGRSMYRTNSPLLSIRGWAIRNDAEINPLEDARIILIGDVGRAFAVYAPRQSFPRVLKEGERDPFLHSGYAVTAHLYTVPRGRYDFMVWQQGGVLCGPIMGLEYE